MKLQKPINENYCGVIVEIKNIIPLNNCDNLVHTEILNSLVVVDKSTKIGMKGVFFPVETQLSKEFLSVNNLYREPILNSNVEKKGYFEENGRIRCVKLRGHGSNGIFMPIVSLTTFVEDINEFNIGDEFDHLNGVEICKKYVPKITRTEGKPGSKKGKDVNNKLVDLLVDKQFNFHIQTTHFDRNLFKIQPSDLLHITYKTHGNSGIASNVLIKKELKWHEKLLIKLGINIPKSEYGYIYSSGKPKSGLVKGIVGKYENPNQDYYSSNIWAESFNYLKPYLTDGLTFYYEIVGYEKSGGMIQNPFDYGCVQPTTESGYVEGVHYKIMIYRITYTNPKGIVYEFTGKQVQDYCVRHGLTPVYELYYGFAKDFVKYNDGDDIEIWQKNLLAEVKNRFNEKDCFMCKNKLPEEGCCVRIEGLDLEVYKQKSERFKLKETEAIDKGQVDTEEDS